MKTISVEEFKANFSEVLMKGRKIVAILVLKTTGKKTRRKIGILEGKGEIKSGTSFNITEEEFLNP